jgi:hypothetical protein
MARRWDSAEALTPVIPAKAGIQCLRGTTRVAGFPPLRERRWVPAFAGTTLGSRLRGSDGDVGASLPFGQNAATQSVSARMPLPACATPGKTSALRNQVRRSGRQRLDAGTQPRRPRPSFPRRRESSAFEAPQEPLGSRLRGNDARFPPSRERRWIPAYAGTTVTWELHSPSARTRQLNRFQQNAAPCLRHSRQNVRIAQSSSSKWPSMARRWGSAEASTPVIPAKAGIQCLRGTTRVAGFPPSRERRWVPAVAGTTLGSRRRGNDGVAGASSRFSQNPAFLPRHSNSNVRFMR